MDKAKVFIASSGRTLTLAEKLRDELQKNELCEGVVWSEESRRQPGATIIEMLENAAENYDFAVIILARDDVIVGEKGDTLKARDNCVFEAGLFAAYLRRERCFLVNSVDQRDLPSDLGGIISLPFTEPPNLFDREACAKAVRNVSGVIKDSVQRLGRTSVKTRLSLLSADEVFRRERPLTDGGELYEGQIVLVCDYQPLGGSELAAQVSRNLVRGINYLYFLHFSDDTIEKICQALQVIVVAGVDSTVQLADFSARLDAVNRNEDRILAFLDKFSSDRSLRITLLRNPQQFCFRVHNATDNQLAKLYARYRASGFILWSEGQNVSLIMRDVADYISYGERERIFVPPKNESFSSEDKRQLENALDLHLAKYFPGIKDKVKRIVLGRK